MNLLTSTRLILAGLVFLLLTSLATADGPRKHQAGRQPNMNRPNESIVLRKRLDKSSPAKQPGQQGITSPSSLKPPTSTKPASGIIAILIGM